MSRSRAWRRKKDYAKAKRKKEIVKSYGVEMHWYKYDGQYIKGKIHCSCLMCSCKTNGRGRYGPSMNYSHSDWKKIDKMKYGFSEYQNTELQQ